MKTIYEYQLNETRQRATGMSLGDLKHELYSLRIISNSEDQYSDTSRLNAGLRARIIDAEVSRRMID